MDQLRHTHNCPAATKQFAPVDASGSIHVSKTAQLKMRIGDYAQNEIRFEPRRGLLGSRTLIVANGMLLGGCHGKIVLH